VQTLHTQNGFLTLEQWGVQMYSAIYLDLVQN
jgi:hypothetical protein